MAGEIARGLGDVKIGVLTGNDVAPLPAALIDVPGARTLEFQAEADTETWDGDNTTIAIAQGNKTGTGSFAWGRMTLPALAMVLGGTAATSGVAPNVITTYNEPGTPSSIYVQIIGQTPSYDNSGSAYRVTIMKANFSSPAESLGQQEWNEPTLDFQYIPAADGRFVKREQYQTEIAIATA